MSFKLDPEFVLAGGREDARLVIDHDSEGGIRNGFGGGRFGKCSKQNLVPFGDDGIRDSSVKGLDSKFGDRR